MIISAYIKVRNLQHSVFFSVFSNIIFILSASIASAVLNPILGIFLDYVRRDVIVGDLILYTMYTFMVFILAFSVSRRIGRIYHAKVELLEDCVKKPMIGVLALSSVITLLPFWAFTFLWDVIFVDPISPIINAFFFSILFALFVFALIASTNNARKDADLRIKEELLKNLQDYTRNIENMAMEMRRFRHDHYNLILGFNGYLVDKDFDGLRNYYHAYIASFNEETIDMTDQRLDTLARIAPPILKGLFTAKILYAQQLKIVIYIDIPHDIKCIDTDSLVDLCRAAGILLDNAIEACIDNVNSKMSLGAMSTLDGVVFIFKNTCSVPHPNIEEMYKMGYSTKGADRGIGLHTVSQIIRKNEKLSLETKIESDSLIQLLNLRA